MFLYLLFEPNLTFQLKIMILCVYTIVIVIAMSAHEFAHAFAAVKSGDNTPKALKRYSLNPFRHIDGVGLLSFLFFGIGWARPVEINPFNFKGNYKLKMFWVSISGVLTNLIIAFLSGAIFYTWVVTNYFNFFAFDFFLYLFSSLIQVNMMLFVFNLLPIFPLDGYNAVASFLKVDNKYCSFMRRYGNSILWGLILVMIVIEQFTQVYPLTWLADIIYYPIDRMWSLIFLGA